MAINTQPRCGCTRCTIRGLMGPAIITTLGVLFLLSELRGGALSFGNTYPLVLIVIGAILFGSAMAPMEGHIEPNAPVAPPPPASFSNPPAGQGR